LAGYGAVTWRVEKAHFSRKTVNDDIEETACADSQHGGCGYPEKCVHGKVVGILPGFTSFAAG